jgi:AraC-like DNA-binding protein
LTFSDTDQTIHCAMAMRAETNGDAVGGIVRIGPFASVPELLRSMGTDPGPLLESVGLDLHTFEDPDHRIPFVMGGRLLEVCAQRTGCPHFGLLMGQRAGLPSLGLVGALVQHSPTVDAALRSLTVHLHLQSRGGVPTRTVEGERAALGYAIYQPGMPGSAQVHDATMAIGFNIMRTLCGSSWLPSEVRFAHLEPADVQVYRRFFRAPLRFDMDRTEIQFPRRWLERTLPGSDAELYRFFQSQVAERETRSNDGPAEEVSRALRTMLVAGRGTEEHVARVFSISSRTLHRRLKAEGISLRTIIDQVRCEIAFQLLRDTYLSVSDIAATLDYTETSAFTRAFRRWTDTAPTTWRAENRRT